MSNRHELAWIQFYPEGNGKAKKGYVLHHVDPMLKYVDPIRYAEWRIEDLVMITRAEHASLHRPAHRLHIAIPVHYQETKQIHSWSPIKGKRWWNKDGKNKSSVECPGEGWILGHVSYKTSLEARRRAFGS